MPPKAQKQIVFKVDSPEHYDEITDPASGKLMVIDLHQAWCGPCGIMEQNYRAMYFNIENAENRIGFWNCSEECVPQDVLTSLRLGPLTCKPRFLIYAVSHLSLSNQTFRMARRRRKSTELTSHSSKALSRSTSHSLMSETAI